MPKVCIPCVVVDDGILHGWDELVAQRHVERGVGCHDGIEPFRCLLHLVVRDGEGQELMTPRARGLEAIGGLGHEGHEAIVVGAVQLIDVHTETGGCRIFVETLVQPRKGYPLVAQRDVGADFVGVDALVLTKLL